MKRLLLIIFAFLLIGCHTKSKKMFVVAGQSNAMGVGDSSKTIYKKSNCFEYDSQKDSFIALKDPVGQNHLGFQKAKTGSFIPSFAYNYAELTGNTVYIVQCAKGGSALNAKAETNQWGNWSDTGKLLKNSFAKIDSAIIKSKVKPEAIIWAQGENDGTAIGEGLLSSEEYEKSLKQLIITYKQKYGNIPFLIVETGRHSTCKKCDEGFEIVRKLQRKLSNKMENVHIGYNETEYFIFRKWLKDPVHYNQIALNDIGKKLAHFYKELEDQ